MPEQDDFEARLAAAYRRYVEGVPTEVDGAAVAHEVARATTRRITWRWALPARPLPALAWLLLLGLLLGALLGTSMLMGGEPRLEQGRLATCPPGADPDQPGPVDQARPAADSLPASLAAIDRGSGKLIVVAAGPTEGVLETWAFDLCTNTWARMTAVGGPSGRSNWVNLVYDRGSDLVVSFDENGHTWAYDVDRDTWRRRADMPAELIVAGYATVRYAYDPDDDRTYRFGGSGVGVSGVWTYDAGSDAWAPARQADAGPALPVGHDHQLVAYDGSAGRFVGYNAESGRTWQYDPASGTWTSGHAFPPLNTGYFASGGEIAYDEAIGRTIVFSDGIMAAYDATADAWETLYDWTAEGGRAAGPDGLPVGPLARLMHSMAYDPINERTVVAFGSVRTADGWREGDDVDVLAYDATVQTDIEPTEGETMYRTASGAFLALLLSAAPAVAADAQPTIVTGSETRNCTTTVCTGTHEATDPRVSGDLTIGFLADCWAGDVCTFSGTITIANEDGSWDGQWTGFRDESGWHRTMGWMTGSGAYEGWSYLLNLVEPGADPGADFKGIIFPGDLRDSVASSQQPTE